MLEPVLDLLVHGCLIVSVSSFLIMLALQPPLPAGGSVATAASRGVCSASRAVLVRLLSGSSQGDSDVDSGVTVAPPPPPRPSRNSRHCCERCATSSWPDVVVAVTASLCLDDDDDDDDDDENEDIAAAVCGGCAAAAAVEGLLERKEASERELREAFYVFDRDEDGFVGAAELWNVLRRLGMLPLLPVLDGAAAAVREEEEDCCARMIAAHDGDGDGRISFPEFRAMMEHAA